MTTIRGTVTGVKMQRTVTVTAHRSVLHRLYAKRYPVSKKFLADPGEYALSVGDFVEITECRPLSKRKHFRVTAVLKKTHVVGEFQEESDIEGVIHRAKNNASSIPPASSSS